MYFREPYVINLDGVDGQVIIIQPSLGDVVELGEKRFYSTLNLFTTNTTAFRLQLWEQGIDWNELSDFELFIMIISNADKEVYKTFLPDLDFSKFGVFEKQNSDGSKSKVMYNWEEKIEINEQVYYHISQYLRNVFNIFPEEKITNDRIMKKWFIDKDKRELKNMELKKNKKENSSLLPVISGCVNHPGFKYKTSELKELGIFQFYDSAKRLQVYESATALQKGMMSGFVDAKGIQSEDYNFMREI